jgi:hypothetical protein
MGEESDPFMLQCNNSRILPCPKPNVKHFYCAAHLTVLLGSKPAIFLSCNVSLCCKRGGSKPLEHGRDALSAADAHRHQAVASADPL